MQSDFFTSRFGATSRALWRRSRGLLWLADLLFTLRIFPSILRARRESSQVPIQKILLVGIEVPGREATLHTLIKQILGDTIHDVTTSLVPMEKRGKFDNINSGLERHNLRDYDWILIVDDDVAVPKRFLDVLVYFCVRFKLEIAQPAHRFLSFSCYAVTERHWATNVRRSNFVEIGPVTLLRSNTFPKVVPFPHLRYAWGLDILWSDLARRNDWQLGIVDTIALRHLRPVGGSYSTDAAIEEAKLFLLENGITSQRAELFGVDKTIC